MYLLIVHCAGALSLPVLQLSASACICELLVPILMLHIEQFIVFKILFVTEQ